MRIFKNPSLDEKRERALKYLGENWVLHPNYIPRERHSFITARWYPHRTLRSVYEDAAKELKAWKQNERH